MSKMITATGGHVGVYAAGRLGDAKGEHLIGLQVEDGGGSKILTAVKLTCEQARAVALELLARATDEPMMTTIRRALRGGGFLP